MTDGSPGSSDEFEAPNKREALLRAALELFAQRTFGATAVPEIAARARVGTGTVYRHFTSKEDLANTVYRACKTGMVASVRDALASGGSVEERFLRIWNALAGAVTIDPTALRFVEMQIHDEYLDEESRAVSDAAFVVSEELILEGQRAGLICNTDPRVLISLCWGAFVGLFKEQAGGRYALDDSVIALAGVRAWRMISA